MKSNGANATAKRPEKVASGTKIPFDIKKAVTGKYRIVTRGGMVIKRLVWFKGKDYAECVGIYQIICPINGQWLSWAINGRFMHLGTSSQDLLLIEP